MKRSSVVIEQVYGQLLNEITTQQDNRGEKAGYAGKACQLNACRSFHVYVV